MTPKRLGDSVREKNGSEAEAKKLKQGLWQGHATASRAKAGMESRGDSAQVTARVSCC